MTALLANVPHRPVAVRNYLYNYLPLMPCFLLLFRVAWFFPRFIKHHTMAKGNDLTDNKRDEDRMKGTPAKMDLPQMHDIPGQENIKPAPMGELADTTASSSDEEGAGLLDDLNETNADNNNEPLTEGETNVTEEERRALEDAASRDPSYEEETRMHGAEVDMADADGDPLNEGEELDVPGSEDDDQREDTGAEDEENNEYSIDKND